MKTAKKMFAILLALTLAVVLAIPAFAAGPDTITINSKTSGHTYQAYQVFSGTYDTASGKLSDTQWGTGVDNAALLTALQANPITGLDFSTCTNAEDVAGVINGADAEKTDAFAAIVAQHLSTTPTGTGTLTAGTTYTYTISNLADGYYFVNEAALASTEGSSYTRYMLQVGGSVTVNAKADVPSVTKKVLENNDTTYQNTWNDAADYSIGDSVPFRLVGTVPDMTGYTKYTYQFTDTVSGGLTFNADSVHVYYAAGGTGTTMSTVNSAADTTGWTEIASTNYTTTAAANGFTLAFSDLKTVTGVAAGGYIVVQYNATLNTGAVIGNPGNPNGVTLTYSNNPANSGTGTPDTGTTPKDEVVVFTFNLPVNKVIKGSDTALTGAAFALFANKTDADAEASAPSDANLAKAMKFDSTAAGTYTYDAAAGTTQTLSDNGGSYAIKGLDQGTYYLVEIAAPAGYNRLTTSQTVKIVPTYTANYKDGHTPGSETDLLTASNVSLNGGTAGAAAKIENASGSLLPSTGGMGTAAFTAGGILLMGGAAALFAAKRKGTRQEH